MIRSPRSEAVSSFKLRPTRPPAVGSAPLCALNPMVTTKWASERAGDTSRSGSGGRSPPGKTQ
eukprot:15444442-Alexandrium_andersonii.AAC.1